ncbi:heme exporter protein CcmD [Shimia sp.]|jgi:heme exporter protein D|nr:heme exporter protein CcmD [Shimia sp.]MBO6898873.1 heme exporter protein CcmD [Shimia sp.]MCH2069042.1 heme exporter protein CcmD [Shimia sp.]
MMPDLGKYADTVLSSYAVSLLLIVGLIWWSLRAARKARAELDDVEGRRK